MGTGGIEASDSDLMVGSMIDHNVATTFEFVGTVVTALGLFNAQSRVTYGDGLGKRLARLWGRFWDWVTRKRRDVVVSAPAMQATAAMGTPTVTVSGFQLGDDLTPDEKFAALADQARALATMINAANKNITHLGSQIRDVSAKASHEVQEALGEMRSHVQSLREQLKSEQRIDLRLAIWGLGITGFGVFLSFFG
jgi:hypothetical protein